VRVHLLFHQPTLTMSAGVLSTGGCQFLAVLALVLKLEEGVVAAVGSCWQQWHRLCSWLSGSRCGAFCPCFSAAGPVAGALPAMGCAVFVLLCLADVVCLQCRLCLFMQTLSANGSVRVSDACVSFGSLAFHACTVVAAIPCIHV
jgi:hypothetical protein